MTTLREARRAKAFSIREFAKAAGVAAQTVVTAEKGEPVRLTSIRKMSQALGVDPLEIEEFRAVIKGEDRTNDARKSSND